MDELIKDELDQVLKNWHAGQRIAAIPLGHPVRVNAARVEERHTVRQLKIYEYCFELIDAGLADAPESWASFCAMASSISPAELSNEEKEAAESLAWKALLRGWRRATAGFSDADAITLRRSEAAE